MQSTGDETWTGEGPALWGVFSSTDFRILTVCTGNIWRSPSAAVLLADALGAGVRVTSAGTRAVVGESMDYSSELRLRRLGLSAGSFKSRQLSPSMVRSQDLVLALARDHLQHVLGIVGARPERTFTLLELARIVESPGFPVLPKGSTRRRLRGMVRLAHEYRHLAAGVEDLDVPDPFGQSPRVMDESFRLIVNAVDTIARVAGTQGTTAVTHHRLSTDTQGH